MLIADALMEMVQLELFKSKSFRTVTIITGKGLGSGSEGPVLQAQVPLFLKHNFGPDISPVRGNDGRFRITKKALEQWVAADEGSSSKFDLFHRRMTNSKGS